MDKYSSVFGRRSILRIQIIISWFMVVRIGMHVVDIVGLSLFRRPHDLLSLVVTVTGWVGCASVLLSIFIRKEYSSLTVGVVGAGFLACILITSAVYGAFISTILTS